MSKLQKAPCTAAMAFCAAALLSSASAGADDSSAGAADKPDSSSPLSLSGYAVRSYMAVGGVISAIRPFAGLTLTDGSRKLSVDVCNGSPVIPTYLCDATVGETLKISGDVSVSVKVGLIAHSLWEHDGDKSGLLVGANRYLAYSQYLGYRPYANSDGLGGQLELRYGGDSSTLLSYTRASGYLPSGMPSNDLGTHTLLVQQEFNVGETRFNALLSYSREGTLPNGTRTLGGTAVGGSFLENEKFELPLIGAVETYFGGEVAVIVNGRSIVSAGVVDGASIQVRPSTTLGFREATLAMTGKPIVSGAEVYVQDKLGEGFTIEVGAGLTGNSLLPNQPAFTLTLRWGGGVPDIPSLLPAFTQ